MPEWKEEIRHRLAGLKLEPTCEGEIVEELSQHLEDRYAEMLTSGVTPEGAYRAAFSELRECELLAHALRRVERPVMHEPIVAGGNRRRHIPEDLWQDLGYGLLCCGRIPGSSLWLWLRWRWA